MMTDKDRSCLCKRRFDTIREAMEAADKCHTVLPIYAYFCEYGPHLHLTKSDRGSGKILVKPERELPAQYQTKSLDSDT